MKQAQATPQIPQSQKPTEQKPTESMEASSDILDKIAEAQKVKELYTCANRFSKYRKTHMSNDEGECKCTNQYGKVLEKEDADRWFWQPIRCDEDGNPLPGAVPLHDKGNP